MRPTTVRSLIVGLLAARATVAAAQGSPPVTSDTAVKIEGVKVSASTNDNGKVSTMQALTLPATASVTATRVRQTVNALDAEDAVKYLPSVFLRKRNNGDTQATMATRVWGVSSSARSLVYADGIPLTALIANNNTIGGPRWGMVAPEEVQRIDMMYGPFSAAYPGNSMGAVMEIATRMPAHFEASIDQTQAVQSFDLYGTKGNFGTSQSSLTIGDRLDRFSFWASGNYQDSHSQPLTYATSASFPSGTTGGYTAQNKLGSPANVLGATGLLHTGMAGGHVRMAYDLTPNLRASYSFGDWENDADATTESYLDASGHSTFANQAAFAAGTYHLSEQHQAHSFSLRSDHGKDWDFDAAASLYRFNHDRQRFPTASSDTTFSQTGRIASLDGTGWSNLDLKAAWHAGGLAAMHTVAFGVHADRYRLNNPTYNTTDWRTGDSVTSVATEGDGKTRTYAIWAQDGWWLTPSMRLTYGGRMEWWRAFDGYNANGSTAVRQKSVDATRFSPKAVLAWSVAPSWDLTASLAKAYRFATPAELYQLVSTGSTFTSPDPNLKPDNTLSAEVRVEHPFRRFNTKLSLFQDDVHDAIISQFLPLVSGSSTLYSYLANVDHVRARGVEAEVSTTDLFVRGLGATASGTLLDARTLAISGRASATAPPGSAIGKRLPNIPDKRFTVLTTYQPIRPLTVALAGRYNGKIYTTLDNADVNPNTYQGFSQWFVADAKATVATPHWTWSLGVDNMLNRKYFLFHPFPQRTFVASMRRAF
jgi:iron complex outermembrane receptor protein